MMIVCTAGIYLFAVFFRYELNNLPALSLNTAFIPFITSCTLNDCIIVGSGSSGPVSIFGP